MGNAHRQFVVSRVERESASAASFYLSPRDGGEIGPFAPGQYVPVTVEIDGKRLTRFYSISGKHPGGFRITVKREPAPLSGDYRLEGRCSSHLHDNIAAGSVLDARPPLGQFVLGPLTASPIVMIAAGIGITPFVGMIEHASAHEPDRVIHLFYGVRNSAEHPFKNRLRELAQQYRNFTVTTWYSRPLPTDRPGSDYDRAGRLDAQQVLALAPRNVAEYLLCGPGAMLQSMAEELQASGVDKDRIRTESFTRELLDEASSDIEGDAADGTQSDGPTVRFTRSGIDGLWEEKYESLLDFAEQFGIEISAGCRYGDCGTCLTELLDGAVVYNHRTGIRPDEGYCLPCSCRPSTSITLNA